MCAPLPITSTDAPEWTVWLEVFLPVFVAEDDVELILLAVVDAAPPCLTKLGERTAPDGTELWRSALFPA